MPGKGRLRVANTIIVTTNAIVAMRFDTSDLGTNWTGVRAYGSAVIVPPIAAGEPGSTLQSAPLAV